MRRPELRRRRRPALSSFAALSTFRRVPVSRRRQVARLPWVGAPDARHGSRQRGQGRAAARPLRRCDRARTGAHRAEPGGRRGRRARSARRSPALLGGTIGTFDDVFDRIASTSARPRGRRTADARAPPRARADAAERPRPLVPFGRVRRRTPRGDARARGGIARPRRRRGRPRPACTRLPRRSSPSSGSRIATACAPPPSSA